jgi:hypothetical protein
MAQRNVSNITAIEVEIFTARPPYKPAPVARRTLLCHTESAQRIPSWPGRLGFRENETRHTIGDQLLRLSRWKNKFWMETIQGSVFTQHFPQFPPSLPRLSVHHPFGFGEMNRGNFRRVKGQLLKILFG